MGQNEERKRIMFWINLFLYAIGVLIALPLSNAPSWVYVIFVFMYIWSPITKKD